jgi:hypothetical protein
MVPARFQFLINLSAAKLSAAATGGGLANI